MSTRSHNIQKILLNSSSKHSLDPLNEFLHHKRIKLQQIIPENGSSSPNLLKITPNVSPRSQEQQVSLKQGIPDVLAFQDVSRIPSFRNIQYKVPRDNMRITETLWKNFKINLKQGIPDPFRVPHASSSKKSPGEEYKNNEKEHKETQFETESTKSKNPEKKSKNLKNCQKKNCEKKEKIHKSEIKNDNSRFLNPKMQREHFQNCGNCESTSKVKNMVTGIFKKCKNTVRNLSKTCPNDFNVNFVCYRCNYPCFRVCRVENCGEFIEKKRIHKNDYGNSRKNGENSRKINYENSRKNGDNSRKMNQEINYFNNSGNSGEMSLTPTTFASISTSDSIPEVLSKKTSDRGNISFEKKSKNSLNSIKSSERMRKLIGECYPPVLEKTSGPDVHGKVSIEEIVIKSRDYAEENAILLDFRRNFDHTKKLNFGVFGGSRDSPVGYKTAPGGGDRITEVLNGFGDDVVIESYSDEAKELI